MEFLTAALILALLVDFLLTLHLLRIAKATQAKSRIVRALNAEMRDVLSGLKKGKSS